MENRAATCASPDFRLASRARSRAPGPAPHGMRRRMEAFRSGRSGGVASVSGSGGGKRSSIAGCSIHSLSADLLCRIFALLDHFDIVRCSVVCKYWKTHLSHNRLIKYIFGVCIVGQLMKELKQSPSDAALCILHRLKETPEKVYLMFPFVLNNLIFTSSLMMDHYLERNSLLKPTTSKSIQLETSLKSWMEELAMEDHRLSCRRGFAKVDQWCGHHASHQRVIPIISHFNSFLDSVNICRMKRGFILTGGGDKVLRLWSAESCNYMDEYSIPGQNQVIDCDFDENKIVGLTSNRICIWRRNSQRGIVLSREGIFTRGLCMRYIDPEAVIGCDDGRVSIFDMYSAKCTRIIRMLSGPVTCLALTDDQLVIGGSSFGNIAIADLSSGERLGFLKSDYCPTGLKTLSINMHSYSVFGGSTSGYAHCWDLRSMRPIWEQRVSPNVIYSVHHLSNDTSILAVGGLDGVLRILDQRTGEILSSWVMDMKTNCESRTTPVAPNNEKVAVEKKVRNIPEDANLDVVPRHLRPPITCLAVGMKKIVTTHNEKFINVWRVG